MKREDIRNVAIIAHVDHGKTTLVDQLLRQSGVFRANQEVEERVMDSNDIERERGITILSKNTAVFYKDTKINIIDTPGHADFGGEVERVLKMVNGVILVVDAYEGAMPQTKFVLRKALELDLAVVVLINKIDRPEARPEEVIDEILELLMDLDASEAQLDCPFLFASARDGYAKANLDDPNVDMGPLFQAIIDHIPAPEGDPDAGTQVLISTIDYNEYVGRIGVGKVDNGVIRVNQDCALVNHHDPDKMRRVKIGKLYEFDGLNRVEVQEAKIGSIVAISGIPDLHIGDTLCSPENPEAIPFQKISEPTIAMNFMVNDSPLAGQEGKFITSRHLRDRLFRELNTDVSLRVEETDSPDCFKVSGRGELHLSVLIENMRREGFEFAVSKAEVLYKYNERNQKLEPMELAYIDVPEEFTGAVIQKLTGRKGELQGMSPANGGYTRLEFSIPARGLIGYRGEFMTESRRLRRSGSQRSSSAGSQRNEPQQPWRTVEQLGHGSGNTAGRLAASRPAGTGRRTDQRVGRSRDRGPDCRKSVAFRQCRTAARAFHDAFSGKTGTALLAAGQHAPDSTCTAHDGLYAEKTQLRPSRNVL